MFEHLVVRHAKEADVESTLVFHSRRVGDYLWPRSADYFNTLVDYLGLFVVCEADMVRGMCYVAPAEDEWEFGGLCVDEALRGRGIGTALGRAAISSFFIYRADDPHVRSQLPSLIAHVHEFNPMPRRVLTDQLGFQPTERKITLPGRDAPSNMRLNERGELVGDIFQFSHASLATFADWLEGYDGVLTHRSAGTRVDLDVDVWKERDFEMLRELGAAASQ